MGAGPRGRQDPAGPLATALRFIGFRPDGAGGGKAADGGLHPFLSGGFAEFRRQRVFVLETMPGGVGAAGSRVDGLARAQGRLDGLEDGAVVLCL